MCDNLEKQCEIPKSALSVLLNHEQLDRDHVKDDTQMIQRMFESERDCLRLKNTIESAALYFDRFSAKVGSLSC